MPSIPLSPGTCAATEVRPVTAATRHHRTSPDYRPCISTQTCCSNGTTRSPRDDTLSLLRSRRAEVPQLRRLELCQVALSSKCPTDVIIRRREKVIRGRPRAYERTIPIASSVANLLNKLTYSTVLLNTLSAPNGIQCPFRDFQVQGTYGVSIGIFFPSRSFNNIRTSEISRQPALLNSMKRRLHWCAPF